MPRLMTLTKDRRGYLQTRLTCNKGELHHCSAHRAVALAHIPNPKGLATVNHIDGDKTNNTVENLEWMSDADNIEHGQAKHYRFTNPDGNLVEVFNLSKFCRENDLHNARVYSLIHGKIKHYNNWRYVNG